MELRWMELRWWKETRKAEISLQELKEHAKILKKMHDLSQFHL